MYRRMMLSLLVAALLGMVGCGKGQPPPVEKSDPVPRQRFPQANK